MKFALVNGEKVEATKGVKGTCPCCGSELIARCGEVKINHWAHKGNLICDPWWENETGWHRSWKGKFPKDWQEKLHFDESGEKHIADVKTDDDWCIEFQHSYLNPEERRARNAFYRKLVWVVDGTRRKTDIDQLSRLLGSGIRLKTKLLTLALNPGNKNRLLAEWYSNDSLVFFDFKQIDRDGQRFIWFALPKVEIKDAYIPAFSNDLFIQAFPVSWFIGTHINGMFDQFFSREIYEHVLQYCKELSKIRRRYKNGIFPDPKFSWLIA